MYGVFPCQKHCKYTEYTYKCLVLANPIYKQLSIMGAHKLQIETTHTRTVR